MNEPAPAPAPDEAEAEAHVPAGKKPRKVAAKKKAKPDEGGEAGEVVPKRPKGPAKTRAKKATARSS